MGNPFEHTKGHVAGPANDLIPVVNSDTVDIVDKDGNPAVAVSLYVETAGDLVFISEAGETRTIAVPDFFISPCGARRVLAATTASGIHAYIVS